MILARREGLIERRTPGAALKDVGTIYGAICGHGEKADGSTRSLSVVQRNELGNYIKLRKFIEKIKCGFGRVRNTHYFHKIPK